MKFTERSAGFGHAPEEAICTLGDTIKFDEGILSGLSNQIIQDIQESGGALPDYIADAVAQHCEHYSQGVCTLLGTNCRR